MKKIKMIIMFFGIFLLLGAVNVKAYDVTSLSGTYSVTINKFKLNLYEVPEENATSVALFANPITYELPMGTNDFQITGDTLKAKELRVDENITIPLSLVELSDNFNATKVGEFLNNQTFDKTKTYYGDIEVEYTVNSFPSTFRSFSQVNAIRYFMEQISEMFNAFVTAEGSGNVSTSASFTLEKPGLVTTTLTSGTSFTTTQMLNLFTYDGTVTEGNKLSYSDQMNEDDYSLGMYGYNFGIFSESTTFDIENVPNTDRAIMFSVIDGMDKFIDYANMATMGDDYVGDVYDNDDEFGTEVVKVANTAAERDMILMLIGLILVFSGLILVGNIVRRKRYN